MVPLAKDIMTRQPITVTPQTSLEEAMALLLDHSISGMPVVDDEGHLVGIISEKDLLVLAYETLYGQQPPYTTVGELMTPSPTTFEADTDILEIAESLIDNNFRRVPILEDGKLVGIISRADLIRAINDACRRRS